MMSGALQATHAGMAWVGEHETLRQAGHRMGDLGLGVLAVRGDDGRIRGGTDALSGGRAVLAADLSSVGSQRRWPAFAPAAMQRGVRAVFSFPVQRGAIRFGVLGVYRLLAGPLSRSEMADARLCADVALALALDDRAVSPAG